MHECANRIHCTRPRYYTRHYTILMHSYSNTLHSAQVLRGSTLYACTHIQIRCTRPRYYAALHYTHALILAYTALDSGTTRLYTVRPRDYAALHCTHALLLEYTALDPGTTRLYTVLMPPYSHTLHSTQVLRGSALYFYIHALVLCTHTALTCT
jgi:hypothetical protein